VLERERELSVIDRRLDETVAGRGGLVVIEGPAGIGKSALVERARAAALERNVAVAHARGSELERADAFGVVRQLFEPRLRAMSAAARHRVLGGAAALAAPVVLPETAPIGRDDGSSFPTLHGLYWLVAGLAEERPQLLAVDDVHWADEASVRFLQFIANRLDDFAVLVLTAQRPDPAAPSSALRAAPAVTMLAPAGLSVGATATALADGDGSAVAPAFAAACHDATGGNPLLVRRIAVGLRDRGVPFSEAGIAELGRVGPEVVAGAVDAAMARLGSEETALARAVAVLGDEAPLSLAAALADVPAEAAAGAADRLVRSGIFEDGRPLRFQHALVRDAVLGVLTAGERAEAHGRAARLLASLGAPDRRSPRTSSIPSRRGSPRSRRRWRRRRTARYRPARRRRRAICSSARSMSRRQPRIATRCCSLSPARRATLATRTRSSTCALLTTPPATRSGARTPCLPSCGRRAWASRRWVPRSARSRARSAA
jgi:hypothetical protein